MYYQIDQTLKKITTLPSSQHSASLISLYTYEEWRKYIKTLPVPMILPKPCDTIHFCRLECYPEYLLGTLCIPTKHYLNKKKQIIFYIEPNKITFVEDTGFMEKLLDHFIATKEWDSHSIECFFVDFLEELIKNDLLYVEELENRMSKLEVAALNGEVIHFNHHMMDFRKELLTYHYYYSQLIDIAEVLKENENGYFQSENLKIFETFIRRTERLQNIILMLRDSASQIREEYQSQIDLKQNHTMRILTVVTSVFLPLTLIVGWYGMNFKYMPELGWYYGYPYVIVLSIITIAICLWIFKHIRYL